MIRGLKYLAWWMLLAAAFIGAAIAWLTNLPAVAKW